MVVVPILDVTPLGSTRSGTAAAVGRIVDYLTQPAPAHAAGAEAYFADRAERPGVWRGRGVAGEHLSGEVTPEHLSRLLLGSHPLHGRVLVAATGSAGRAAPHRGAPAVAAHGLHTLGIANAAAILGLDRSYVKRLLLATERHATDPSGHPSPVQPLLGVRDGQGRWLVERAELDRFVRARSEPKVVVAYDATFKWEKSISLAWVQADPATRTKIEAALDEGARVGVSYLESHGLHVRHDGGRVAADGVWAVQYRHTTNRNLEPQLHDHVVIANITATPNGDTRTIAAHALFTHATTAGHLAGQAVRHRLTNTLGYAWEPVVNGTAEIRGVPAVAIRAMSTRSNEIRELTDHYGTDSQPARRIAALASRAAKQHPADYAVLEAKWSGYLDHLGFTATTGAGLQQGAWPPGRADRDRLYAHLEGPAGVTANTAIFDRDTVVRAVIAWDSIDGRGSRLTAADVERYVDEWLASPNVARLTDRPGKWTIEARYTTTQMLDLEASIIRAHTNGHGRQLGVVDVLTLNVEAHIWQRTANATLGADQIGFIEKLTTSGDQFALGVGPAGTGKTTALTVACRAWEAAGYQPLGATVTGAAADVLADTCAIPTRTVAALITALETGHKPFTSRTVLIVDEASTLANRDHHALIQAVQKAGGVMRTIGDPAQHHAVGAGGIWVHLLHTYPDHVARLETNRRQTAPAMADIRHAGQLLRNGDARRAIPLLAAHGRLHHYDTAREMAAAIVSDWYTDRQRADVDGGPVSRMMAEHHTTRRAMNAAAQHLLHADGTIRGTGVRVGDERIHIGDEIITRTQNRGAVGHDGRFLRNGVTGTVIDVGDDDGRIAVTARFPGYGVHVLRDEWLTQQIRPGVNGAIAPAYAITTHVAQGQTMSAGRAVINDTSSIEGIYVALTRGRTDARLYLTDSPTRLTRRALADEAEFPVLLDEPELLDAITNRLAATRTAEAAAQADPGAARIHRLSQRPTAELVNNNDPDSRRALTIAIDRAVLHALHNPQIAVTNDYGQRPPADHPDRPVWDRAVTTRIRYERTWQAAFRPDGSPPISAAGDYRVALHAHRAAHLAALDHLPLIDLLAARAALPLSLERLRTPHELDDALTRRIDRAIEQPADYLTRILGKRPNDEASYRRDAWDHDARSIETIRHHNGLTPTDTPIALTAQAVLGPRSPSVLSEGLRWENAERKIEAVRHTEPEPEIRRSRGIRM